MSQQRLFPTPLQAKMAVPLTGKASAVRDEGRRAIRDILDGKDRRLLIICGPCSLHDLDGAKEYASRLRGLAEQVQDRIVLVMRTYVEKPRSRLGWTGYLLDPGCDGSFDVEKGMRTTRALLISLLEQGVCPAAELLDPFLFHYYEDLLCWGAIGARTVESQPHRQLASGLAFPVGFKNSTHGDTDAAVDACVVAKAPHTFLSLDDDGNTALVSSKGNPYGHVILRGSRKGPNYDEETVRHVHDAAVQAGVCSRILIDGSHGNSHKDHTLQPKVFSDVLLQIKGGSDMIAGIMLESNLGEGRQPIAPQPKKGVSITDACISWEMTDTLIKKAYAELAR